VRQVADRISPHAKPVEALKNISTVYCSDIECIWNELLTIFDTFFISIMRILVFGVLLSMSIVFGQSLAVAHEYSLRSHVAVPSRNDSGKDTLEIRSGATPDAKIQSSSTTTVTIPQPSPERTIAPSSVPISSEVDTPRNQTKKLSRKEILKIPLEELLDLPMETVLEYAKVIDSMKIAGASSVRGRAGIKSKRVNPSSNKMPDTQILDKLNAALQQLQEQKQSGKKTANHAGASREELLRMKLKDLLDMRLGEILKLVNPILASSATSGAQRTPR
jgi:hypothetical protein